MRRFSLAVFALLLMTLSGVVSCSRIPPSITPTQRADLAQCLTARGYAVYVLTWCSHCERQLEAFGESVVQLDVVECRQSLFGKRHERCAAHDVRNVPTWIGPNGDRRIGFQTLEQLAEWSGCLR